MPDYTLRYRRAAPPASDAPEVGVSFALDAADGDSAFFWAALPLTEVLRSDALNDAHESGAIRRALLWAVLRERLSQLDDACEAQNGLIRIDLLAREVEDVLTPQTPHLEPSHDARIALLTLGEQNLHASICDDLH